MKHWLGLDMSPRQAFEFEVFKKRNKESIKHWEDKYPNLKTCPPIYWNGRHWFWHSVEPARLAIYISACEAITYARTRKP